MKRIATVLTLVLALAAMGKPSATEPLPAACDVLAAIDIAATLGAGAAYAAGPAIENDFTRMSLCTAETPDLSARMTLMVRENLLTDVPDVQTLRTETINELRATLGATAAIEAFDMGDAALWVSDIAQLTVWYREGRVMLILTPTPVNDRAAAEAAALKIMAAFP